MDFSIEKQFAAFTPICGIDEAGRGPLAGDVFAAAVILPPNYIPDGLNDSKKLSAAKRAKLYEEITTNAISYAVARASVKEIEQLNILEATLLAMRRAVAALKVIPGLLLVDGNIDRDFTLPAKAIINGDALCPSIAAASIIAKVERDNYCDELDKLYPEYGFAKHKGYGTKAHIAAIAEHGAVPVHRSLFIRKILTKTTNNYANI